MKFTIITPNKNGGRFLEETILSVLNQREAGIDIEYIVLDGGSTDESPAILSKYQREIPRIVFETDSGPVSAINKGLKMATGDIIAWLNADDRYHKGTLRRVSATLSRHRDSALCFGACRIIDERGEEIRRGITRFKELFFPISSQYVLQCLNYVSQPAMFFRRSALEAAGLLRENLVAAWDYDFTLRLWRQGGGVLVSGPPLADFRWHPQSISGQRYVTQFREEFTIARDDAGFWRLQTLLHWFVCWGIIASYTVMAQWRKAAQK